MTPMSEPIDIRRIEVIDEATGDMYRRMTPGERIRLGPGMHETMVRMIDAGLRSSHPDWTEPMIHAEVLRRLMSHAGLSQARQAR